MCNLFDTRVSFSDLLEAFGQMRLPLVKPAREAAPNLQPLDAVRPTDPAPVLRACEGGVELLPMRWGLVADRPKAGPITNYRTEGRRFAAGRCLVPATGFYEFTGGASPKTRWRFILSGEPWFCFAGLWRAQSAIAGADERFTLLTVAAGADMTPYHDRQPVVLGRRDWAPWLTGLGGEAELLAPSPAGALQVARDSPAEVQLPLFGVGA